MSETITVKDLIDNLAELPPDLEILVAGDEEDNEFFPLTNISLGFAEREENPRRGGRYAYKFHQEEYYEVDSETGESEYPGDNAVVLWL